MFLFFILLFFFCVCVVSHLSHGLNRSSLWQIPLYSHSDTQLVNCLALSL